MRARAAGLLFAPLCLAAAAAACKPLDQGAREDFSHRYSCPMERVEVRRRADVQPYDLAFGQYARAHPSPEVANDPGRLALWEKDQRRKRQAWNKAFEAYEVRGCGHQVLMSCSHPDAPDGQGTYTLEVACSEGEYPPGARTPW